MIRKTTLSNNRGWLDIPAAASIARLDAQLKHPLDINSAGRDAALQQKLYDAYRRDPAHNPIALPPSQSVHCKGYAIDTDARGAYLAEHGWILTVYRGGVLVEAWHREYQIAKDKHLGDRPEDTVYGDPEACLASSAAPHTSRWEPDNGQDQAQREGRCIPRSRRAHRRSRDRPPRTVGMVGRTRHRNRRRGHRLGDTQRARR